MEATVNAHLDHPPTNRSCSRSSAALSAAPRTELDEKAVYLLLCSREREFFALGLHSKGIVGEDGQVKAYGRRATVPMVALAEDVNAITPIRCLTRAHDYLTFQSGQCTALRSPGGKIKGVRSSGSS